MSKAMDDETLDELAKRWCLKGIFKMGGGNRGGGGGGNRGGGSGGNNWFYRGAELIQGLSAVPIALRHAQIAYATSPYQYAARIGQANASLTMAAQNRDYRSVGADQVMRRNPGMDDVLNPDYFLNKLQPWGHIGSSVGNTALGLGQVGVGAFGNVGAGLGSIIAYKGIQRILGASGSLGESWGLLTDPKRREDFVQAQVAELGHKTREEIMAASPRTYGAIGQYGQNAENLVNFYRTTGLSESKTFGMLNGVGGDKFSPEQKMGMYSAVQSIGGGYAANSQTGRALELVISGFSTQAAAQLTGVYSKNSDYIETISRMLAPIDRVLGSRIMENVGAKAFDYRTGMSSGQGLATILSHNMAPGASNFGAGHQLELNQATSGFLNQLTSGNWDNSTGTSQIAMLARGGWAGGGNNPIALQILNATPIEKIANIVNGSDPIPDEWKAYGLTIDDARKKLSIGLGAGSANNLRSISRGTGPAPALGRYMMGLSESERNNILSGKTGWNSKMGITESEFAIAKSGVLMGNTGIDAEIAKNAIGVFPSLGKKKQPWLTSELPNEPSTDTSEGSVAGKIVSGSNKASFENMKTAATRLSDILGQAKDAAMLLAAAIPEYSAINSGVAPGDSAWNKNTNEDAAARAAFGATFQGKVKMNSGFYPAEQ
jgi:hypothetical protein